MKTIKDLKEIKQIQKIFEKKLLSIEHRVVNINITWAKGTKSKPCKVYYFEKFQFWYYTEPNIYGKNKDKYKYLNAFSLKEPTPGCSMSAECQLNFPMEPYSNKLSGVISRDDKGIIQLMRKGDFYLLGENEFLEDFKGKVFNGNYAFVAELHSPNLHSQIKYFLLEVNRIKENIID